MNLFHEGRTSLTASLMGMFCLVPAPGLLTAVSLHGEEESGNPARFSSTVKALGASSWAPEKREASLKEAEALLSAPLVTIVEKQHLAESKDPHDYCSIGIYWWPNPLTGGRPYIRRDGKVNPESGEYDHPRLVRFSTVVSKLAQAYAWSGDDRFARRAREWLKGWFLDEKTRMNPHLNYAQAWPGLNSGTPFGIIEGETLASHIPAAVLILHESGQLSVEEWEGIRHWFGAFRKWYEKSPHGREIGEAYHNISTWYDVQRVSFALLQGDDEGARRIVREAAVKRLGGITAQGEMPQELKRAKSWDYCCYHLAALMRLAELGDAAGEDLWHASGPSGGSIRTVLEFLLPYAQGKKEWDYPQAGAFTKGLFTPLAKKGAQVYGDPRFLEVAGE